MYVRGHGHVCPMSTVAEIEAALPELSSKDLQRVEATLRRLQTQRAGGQPPFDDLDALIGSWKEDPAFDAAIRVFEQVDEPEEK